MLPDSDVVQDSLDIPNTDSDVDALCEDISNLLEQPHETDTQSFSAQSTTESSSELNSSFLSLSSTASTTDYHILNWRGENGPGTVRSEIARSGFRRN